MDRQETSKRNIENLNENLNNDEFDVTWGGKRCRYIYNYTLDSKDLINDNDSETDSTRSTQTKSTVEVVSDQDTLSCRSSCNCNEEFDVQSLTLSSLNTNSNSSDSSTILSNEVLQNVLNFNDPLSDTDNEHNEDTDNKLTTQETNLPPPACFIICLQCKKENPNPYFQFCFKCFKNRMDFFGIKPRKPKKKKRLNIFLHKKLKNSTQGLALKENKSNVDNQNELCSFCLIKPKNGIINHGKIGHIVCCYSCAKLLWRNSNKCPLCNVKIKFVTKMIVV